MTIYTQLSPTATPGKRYSFVAKTPAVSEKGVGPFTAQSVLAVPGIIHSFVAKTPEVGGEKGAGLFTSLSVMAIPGQRHLFLPKTLAEIPMSERIKFYKGRGPTNAFKGDNELLELIGIILASGKLD